MTKKNFPVTYSQTLTESFWPLRLKNSEKWLNSKNWKKYQKYAKNLDVKILHDIPFDLEIFSNLFSNPREGSLALKAEKFKRTKNFFKKASFYQKIVKFVTLKSSKTIPCPFKIFQ